VSFSTSAEIFADDVPSFPISLPQPPPKQLFNTMMSSINVAATPTIFFCLFVMAMLWHPFFYLL
jgi:hypothetical protein